MVARLMAAWSQVRSSLWALPLLIVLAAAAVAVAAGNVHIESQGDPVWYLYSGTAKQAPGFLSSLVSAMITMATLVISITMVVLSLAAQQLGPRLILSFMADRGTQAALGLYVGTSIYLMIVLRSIYGDTEGIPNLAVTIGTALVILSMLTLPVFVHHLARSIITDEIIERVGRALDAAAARLLPESGHAPPRIEIRDARPSAPLTLSAGGYVQAIDFERLVQVAAESGCIIRLAVRAGHHGVRGAPYAWVTPASALTDDLKRAAADSVMLGAVRTEYQDLEFSIRQLVELSLRALSPGINDPYTAQAAIDQLAHSLAFIMTRGAAQSAWCDEEGNVRVLLPAVTFEGLVDEALTQIRQIAANNPAVLIRLAEKIGQLLPMASAEQAGALRKHLDLVEAAGKRNIAEPSDLDALQKRILQARTGATATSS